MWDLDARFGESGSTWLYHLVLGADGRAERLRYRFWNGGRQVAGNLLFDEREVTASWTVNGVAQEMVLEVPVGYGFWLPSTVGLGLLAGFGGDVAVSLGADLRPFVTSLRVTHGVEEVVDMRGKGVVLRPLTVAWADQQRTVWLDGYDWPLRMVRGDGLTAVETRYVRY